MTDYLNATAIEIALTIHAELPQLLNPGECESVQQKLALLLQRFDSGEDTDDEILTLLASTPPTRRRMSDLYDQENKQRSLPLALPGEISIVSAPQFQCPHCDERWSRDRIGRPIPICSTHKVLLEPV